MIAKYKLIIFFTALISFSASAQRHLNSGIKVEVVPDQVMKVNFDHPLRDWQGFGVNYVETCQTRDYSLFQQDYSGFSFATQATKDTVMEMIFGEDGLRPALSKLFLDPFHEGNTIADNDNDDAFEINMEGYDHRTTTEHMRYFNREGLKMMEDWGGSLNAIVTLYAPAPWMTKQKYVLGRDLDPDLKDEVAEYIASWAKFLREEENIPVNYISSHNEGDAYYRWPRDGSNPGEDHRDYNTYWTPNQVAEFLKLTRQVLDANGLEDVGLSPGETQTWYRFDQWGYASAIVHDEDALANLDLMTSHSFTYLEGLQSVYYGDFRSTGQDLVHQHKEDVPVWVTSRPWVDGPDFAENIRRDIYESKANGIIPWALISGADQWLSADDTYTDGSMEAAFLIKEDGSLVINKGYYYYKQLTRAGQPGSQVIEVFNYDPSLGVMAFSGEQNSMVIINKSEVDKLIEITVQGLDAELLEGYRTSASEDYQKIADIVLEGKTFTYNSPARSVNTFFAK